MSRAREIAEQDECSRKPLFGIVDEAGTYVGLVTDAFTNSPQGGVLMSGFVQPAAFTTREKAQAAIRRTNQFCDKNHLRWGRLSIVRLYPDRGSR